MRTDRWMGLLGLLTLAAAGPVCGSQAQGERLINIHFPKTASCPAVTGRVYVFLSRNNQGEPRKGPNWFRPEPFFGRDVVQFAPGQTTTLNDSADGFPTKLSQLEAGTYFVQAVLDQKFQHQSHVDAPGNRFSQTARWVVPQQGLARLELTLSQVVPEKPFDETEHVREVRLASPLLTKFHGRRSNHVAAVILPRGYHQQPSRRYPVVYRIPAFSGSHRDYRRFYSPNGTVAQPGQVEFIHVLLSGQCRWGHHVFADSMTNGPQGTALIREFIPAIDQQFRTIAEPTGRFLTGHSSGGWASLWLQVTHPDFFGGVWSTSPDPVDFRDYQQVDLYARPPLSLYRLPDGTRRPLARRGEQVLLWYEDFGRMDDVIARGGQLRSFEAAFSPLDGRGEPRRLWDRVTGRIDPEVAECWKKYDISLKLKRNWDQLKPKLAGKLHLLMGDQDTYYLEGSTRLLKQRLSQLGSDAQITLIPRGDHGILTAELLARLHREMSQQFLKNHPASTEQANDQLFENHPKHQPPKHQPPKHQPPKHQPPKHQPPGNRPVRENSHATRTGWDRP